MLLDTALGRFRCIERNQKLMDVGGAARTFAPPALLLRERWLTGVCGRCKLGSPYGPGLMDLGGIGRLPGPGDRGTDGNCPGDIGRCGYGGPG